MEFKFSGWTTGDAKRPTLMQEQFTLEFGLKLTHMAYLSPPLVRALHRMAFDATLSPKSQTLCMAAVTFLVAPVDDVATAKPPPQRSTLDDLYVAWATLRSVLDMEGQGPLERHWRADRPLGEVLALLEVLPELELRVPSRVLLQVSKFMQLANV